ncbi:hypothetical protein GALL_521690 [mine drainage metagenome]|uniref:Uncharacterized protein n=1 Tax=mine drainage metagenome TaxID=410659 RepID=A0A1J5P697_9ZZZZ
MLVTGNLLRGFVPFAGDEHDVRRSGMRQRLGDGCGAILDEQRGGRILQTGQQILQDRTGRLAAGVVARQHDAVGAAFRGLRHQRTLARVAVAASAEHAP